MSYRSAEKVLPYELIELIQQYVDGDKKGEVSGNRSQIPHFF